MPRDETTVGREPLSSFLARAVAAAVVGMLVARALGADRLVMPLTVAASTGFVAIAVAAGGMEWGYGRLMVGALVLCWLGDVVGPHSFVSGLFSFLLAHLVLVAAFWSLGVTAKPLLAALGVAGVASAAVILAIYPHINGPERLPAIAYAAAISVMVAFAAGTRGGPGWRLRLAAAVLFYVSDIDVALWRFVGGDFPYAWGCYPLYYSACVMLALTAAPPR